MKLKMPMLVCKPALFCVRICDLCRLQLLVVPWHATRLFTSSGRLILLSWTYMQLSASITQARLTPGDTHELMAENHVWLMRTSHG